jgi:hypothetical protein
VAHPRNDKPGLYRPYPAEFGDSFLNRQIGAGVPAAQAVRDYLELDIVQRAQVATQCPSGRFVSHLSRLADPLTWHLKPNFL